VRLKYLLYPIPLILSHRLPYKDSLLIQSNPIHSIPFSAN
jgi:hypothetical protein